MGHKPKAKPTTVHIVPHSHLDPGWLNKVDDMYYGHNFTPCIRDLIAGVHSMLANDSNKRRTFSPEHAVFHAMWWRDASEEEREAVRMLVAGEGGQAGVGGCGLGAA